MLGIFEGMRLMAKGKGGSKDSGGRARGSSSKGKYRSAKTGRYVTKSYGKRHPSTTVKESK